MMPPLFAQLDRPDGLVRTIHAMCKVLNGTAALPSPQASLLGVPSISCQSGNDAARHFRPWRKCLVFQLMSIIRTLRATNKLVRYLIVILRAWLTQNAR